MARYALVNPDKQIDRFGDSSNFDPTVETKTGWRWMLVEEAQQPAHASALETPVSQYVVGADMVEQKWEVTRIPMEQQKGAVKDEAQLRIIARYPAWKQADMTARGVELSFSRDKKGAWTAEEQAEADALQAVWAWIKAMRAAADALEALDPIPYDYRSAKHWPE